MNAFCLYNEKNIYILCRSEVSTHFLACKLLLKWPGQNDLTVLKVLNISIYVCTGYTLHMQYMFVYLASQHKPWMEQCDWVDLWLNRRLNDWLTSKNIWMVCNLSTQHLQSISWLWLMVLGTSVLRYTISNLPTHSCLDYTSLFQFLGLRNII